MVDGCYQPVAGLGVKAGQQSLGLAKHGDRQLALRGTDIGVPADDRHAEGFGGRPHTLKDWRCVDFAIRPDRIHHGDRPPTHGRDVGEVHHHPAPSGKPGIGGNELVHEPLDGQQQISVAIRDGRTIVSDGNLLTGQAKPACDRADVLLGGNAAALAQASGDGVDILHHAAFLGSAINPTSGVANGG